MDNLVEQAKHGAGHAWRSLTEGWRELGARASGALTRFWSAHGTARAGAPAGDDDRSPQTVKDERWPPPVRWSFTPADVYVYSGKVTVRVEAAGLKRDAIHVEMNSPQCLSISANKLLDPEFDCESYRIVQCAYGTFRRDIYLPVAVEADKAQATYENGIIRIVLPRVLQRDRDVALRA